MSAIIEGVSQLVESVKNSIEDGSLQLSNNDWIQISDNLTVIKTMDFENNISENELDDVAWLVISYFEENQTLSRYVAKELANLVGGTKLTGRSFRSEKRILHLKKNHKKIFDFIKYVNDMAMKNETASN